MQGWTIKVLWGVIEEFINQQTHPRISETESPPSTPKHASITFKQFALHIHI